MTDPIAFALAALALLATPGPTNTLLATSGAAAGLGRSVLLVGAEILGYLISITLLALVLGPLVRASHEFSLALRLACGAFLLFSAWKLWREGAATIMQGQPVPFRRVLIATTLNPKGVVFAFVIVPHLHHGLIQPALPYMAGLVGLIGLVGLGWIGIGAGLRASARTTFDSGLARRAGALVLCLFAVLISGSAFSL